MAEFVFKVVSIILPGLLWLKCIASSAESNYEQCFIVGQRRICYLIVSKQHYSWNESHQICNSVHSSLPIFQNLDEQKTVESYLEHLQSSGMTISAFWTPGKIKLLDDYTWVNGKRFMPSGPLRIEPPLNGTHVFSPGKYIFRTEDPSFRSEFLCKSSKEVTFTNWLNDSYRLPLEDVAFTNWSNDSQRLPLEDLCIYVDASYNKWETSSCNDTMSVVCQRRETITSESEPINYIALWSAIGASVLIFTCIGAIVITVVIVKRKISDAVHKQYQGMEQAETYATVDNYETIEHEDDNYDAIDDDLVVDANYESISDANYLDLVETDNNEDVEDRHSANNTNTEEERVYIPLSEFVHM